MQPSRKRRGLIRVWTGDVRFVTRQPFPFRSALGFILVITLALLWITQITMNAVGRVPPKGLHLLLAHPAPVNPGIQPIIVQVMPKQLLVDHEPVDLSNLDTVLRQKLRERPPNWPVYVDGDPDVEWREVLLVIDHIQGLHAEASLVPHKKINQP